MNFRAISGAVLVVLTASVAFAQPPRIQPLLGLGQGPVSPATPPPGTASTADAFFSDDAVREIALDINTKDWQALKDNFLSNTYYPADFKWNGETVRNVGIRSRGTASRSAVRPGLRIDFDRYSTNQKFLGLKSVILRNNITDPSNMHERISFQLFARLGVPVPRVTPVRLILNGVYDGLYSIVESPDKDYLSRILQQNDGTLYKFDRNVGDAPNYFGYVGSDPALYVPHPFKPETNESNPQPQPIADLFRAIEEESEGNFRSTVGAIIDIAAWVKHAAIENYLTETDGFLGDSGMNNYYLYQLQNSRMHVLLPWDKSEAFKGGPEFNILHNIEDVPLELRNHLMARFWKFTDLQQLYYDTLLACANSASEMNAGDGRTWLEREVDREFAQIQVAVAEDPTRPYSVADFNAAVDAMRIFARQRPDYVRSEVERHPPQ